MLTQERLKDRLHYNPETGIFTRNHASPRNLAGAPTGTPTTKYRYLTIRLDGVNYLAHRLAYLYMTGEFPPVRIVQVDRDPHNNRWDNLRLANTSQSQCLSRLSRNNKLRIKGVSPHRDGGYVAAAMKDGHLYRRKFSKLQDAINWRRKKAEELHGSFCNHG